VTALHRLWPLLSRTIAAFAPALLALDSPRTGLRRPLDVFAVPVGRRIFNPVGRMKHFLIMAWAAPEHRGGCTSNRL
jgi:hypothetical protein